jgi:hypothetical protein
VPIALEKESFLPSLEVCAQFVPQRREDWHVTIGLPLGVGDVDLGRIAAEQQILRANMDVLVDVGTRSGRGMARGSVDVVIHDIPRSILKNVRNAIL